MTDFPASHRDLLDAEVATFATIDGEGLPQLTAVWFLHDDDEVKLSLSTARAKTRFLRARPQCSLCIVDAQQPWRYLEIRGRARIDPDDDYLFAGKVGAKYGVNLREYDGPDESRLVVTIEPQKVYAVNVRGE